MGGKIIENSDFTPDNLKRELTNNNYNILHFSTHSIFGADPKNTKLFMFDSSLTLDQLNELILMNMYRGNPIDLLTLSACETARGDERAALGIGGVAVKTGVQSAIATLWKIQDKVAANAMAEFYHCIKEQKMSKAHAIQNVQNKLIHDHQFSNPIHWAPFLLIGNWQ